MSAWAPQHSFQEQLSAQFYQPTQAAPATDPQWLAFNQPLATALGLPAEYHGTTAGLALFSGQTLPDWARPVAQAYAGHQFGRFVPQLGDGRAMLLAELPDQQGQLWDMQLKGSGPTAFSRGGDGLSALGPVLREYLVSEAMHQLGIPTTRALAAVVTGDRVHRQEGQVPGAILTRIARSHLRVGSFEYAAQYGAEAVQQLADYAINRHDPQLWESSQPYLDFFATVASRQAELVAQWLSVGFIHGVMNTDNMSVSGETIDYGPCAFMDTFRRDQCFSAIDRHGRYAYMQQPGIAQWNLARLAECLVPLFHSDQEEGIARAMGVLEAFPDWHDKAWLHAFGRKLGLSHADPDDQALVEDFLTMVESHEADFTLSFASLTSVLPDAEPAPHTLLESPLRNHPQWLAWCTRWHQRLQQQDLAYSVVKQHLAKANPQLIPRNHQIEKAIDAAQKSGDLQHFQRLLQAWANPWQCAPGDEDLMAPPTPEEVVSTTFCGT